MPSAIKINRAPVLTLWASVVAERLGNDRATALSLGKAVAGYSAYAKAQSLGIAEDCGTPAERRRKAVERGVQPTIEILGKRIPITTAEFGVLAEDANGKPSRAEPVERYLESKFGPDLRRVREAMQVLADSVAPAELQARGFAMYESFRPEIPVGVKGWGAAGELDLERIKSAMPASKRPA